MWSVTSSMAGIFGNVFTGWILNSTGSWSVVFGACVLCYMLGLVVYLCWADTKQVKGIEGLN